MKRIDLFKLVVVAVIFFGVLTNLKSIQTFSTNLPKYIFKEKNTGEEGAKGNVSIENKEEEAVGNNLILSSSIHP